MAVIEQEVVENSGLIKEFDEDSVDMLMNIIQKDLYTKPIESSVRETFSNSYDAVKEKNIAISILTGKTTVEDHYVVSSAKSAKNSKFNSEYYNLDYLSSTNKVKIAYTVGTDQRDEIAISDFGVGLANGRLKGYFAPGYSSKRLSKDLLGKYGAGNKSPLATNIEFYVLESWYNGKYTKFMIYDNYYKCIIAKADATQTTEIMGKKEADGEVVDAVEYVHWTDTNRKNGVRVSFEVKKHNKQAFINAVKDQLLYFKESLDFVEVDENGDTQSRNGMFAKILLDTPTFLIADSFRFTNPHILINNVNYGMIDFPELGINKRFGNIALKANASDVDVNAARESVKWTEKTKRYILAAVEHAAYEAGVQLKTELAEYKNPLERYLKSLSNSFLSLSNDPVIANLRRFADSVKADIPIDITKVIDLKLRKQLGIGDTVQADPLMRYIDGKIIVHNINVADTRITVSKGSGISSLKMDSELVFLVADTVTNMRTQMAHYLTKGKGSFQYIIFKDVAKAMMSKEEALTAKIPYKSVLKQHTLFTAYRKVFGEHLTRYCKNVTSIDADEVAVHAKKYLTGDDAAIMVKEDSTSTYTLKAMAVLTIQEEERMKSKREKSLLPYKVQSMPVYETSRGVRSMYSYEEPVSYSMRDAKAADLSEVVPTVYYASTKDRGLLAIAGLMAALQNRHVSSFREEGAMFILVSEENKKHFQQIPDTMDVKEFFKKEHKIVDNNLTMEGGEIAKSYMTNYKVQELLLAAPEYFTIGLSSTELYNTFHKLLISNSMPQEDIGMAETLRKMLRKLTFDIENTDKGKWEDAMFEYFSMSLKQDTSAVKSLFGMLENMCTLQSVGEAQYIEDETLKAQVSTFNSYTVSFYDKTLVDSMEVFIHKYSKLLHLSAVTVGLQDYRLNTKLREQANKMTEIQISEFFNNLNK